MTVKAGRAALTLAGTATESGGAIESEKAMDKIPLLWRF
jgi:hypothetical protein